MRIRKCQNIWAESGKELVAIQFVGLVRGFKFKETLEKIYANLITPLERSGFEVHIFWHTYDKEFDSIIENLDSSLFDIRGYSKDKDRTVA